jgi:hypothetical protein
MRTFDAFVLPSVVMAANGTTMIVAHKNPHNRHSMNIDFRSFGFVT